ncbi:hypothetical protein DTO166G4_4209 [Paecilomyces variotii]|nr:hypothetical protein DTO166G4_4209 [Paecilomyces variotii]KAJ9232378.1 hypothetical protein DTO169E5_7502 [Paecilomyces variotii]KAJ9235147.1 hypothetical protein DTO166G5_4696 [Paecilomyces variotii]KAJ9248692.1 hypothetical protein DTO207G8_7176 [Paecilomyces variotii]KAJ9349852.1 hypothetical protein DTO027B9_7304 [Paecilomyces variotii]
MDAFVSRKRRRVSPPEEERDVASKQHHQPHPQPAPFAADEEESTEMKLALMMSLFPDTEQSKLLEVLISHDGSVDAASSALSAEKRERTSQLEEDTTDNNISPHLLPPAKKERISKSTGHIPSTPTIQSSLSSYAITKTPNPLLSLSSSSSSRPSTTTPITKKGKTLHLFSPPDIAAHTPCSVIHNFLPAEEANALLRELLDEARSFPRYKFQLFENIVESPHTASLYVASPEERRQQISEYAYNGQYRTDVRQITPHMRAVSAKVQRAVNEEVRKRIRDFYPDGKKLKYQSPREWMPNAAFVNCYDGPAESVGFHSDELTYLGPRAIIGSLSLGVEREFRVRKIVARDDDENNQSKDSSNSSNSSNKNNRTDAQGQISIHLPHNSLLVMHAEMQEEWKHCIAPAQTISPHPISGNRRINITYRWYRESLHPRHTPRCRCGVPTVLRCSSRKRETRGRYMWMCYAGFSPGRAGCGFFQWAEFDDDGEPIWRGRQKDKVEEADRLSNFVDGIRGDNGQ